MPWTREAIDLPLRLGKDMAGAFARLQDTLDAGERLAVDGRLLVHPALPEIVAVRDWVAEQVVAQMNGTAPSPWTGVAHEEFTTITALDQDGCDTPDADIASVRDGDHGAVAVDQANRIVAISRPLAARLGWRVEDLVGRRVITLIPPSLREAHVAGFTRHLSSGEAHVLGVPLTLPVLTADGAQVLSRFFIEQRSSRQGRSLYIAWFEPDAEA